ncbi:MAG: DMT family transporter, partial [Burkholderiales bacterium]
ALAEDLSPIALSFWRWALALPILYLLTARELREQWPVIRRYWKLLAFLALISTAPNHAIVYWALHYTTAINVQLFNSTIPAWVILIQWAVLRQRPSGGEGIGLVVSIIGVLAIITAGDLRRLVTLQFNFGDLIILASFTVWSLYAVMLRFRPSELSPFAFIFTTATFGVVILLPAFAIDLAVHGFRQGVFPAADARVWGWLLFIVIGSSVLAATCHSAGVDRIGPARASLFLHLIPVFGALLSVFVLGEQLAWYHAAGFALVLAGLSIANRPRSR